MLSQSPARARFQVNIRIGQTLKTVPLDESRQWFIGRSSTCAIHIDTPAVSRIHAQLHPWGNRVEVEDLGSTNGTWVLSPSPLGRASGMKELRLFAYERRWLRTGQSVQVGPALLELTWADHPDSRRRRTEPSIAPIPVLVDPAMRLIYDQVKRAARGDTPILIVGETGVGKELLAQAVHRSSPRSPRPFLISSCATLPEPLIESELFGYEKAAFSGADSTQIGLLEEAEGGTVFLDEVGELPLAMQSKLLSAMDDQAVLRMGSTKRRPIDVRFVTATNRDLARNVRAGLFRSDLYQRLGGLVVRVPPLRERPAEIEPLARYFIQQFRQEGGETVGDLTDAALRVLGRHDWPGNVRELRNVLERAALLANAAPIEPQHILLDRQSMMPSRPPSSWELPTRVDQTLEELGIPTQRLVRRE